MLCPYLSALSSFFMWIGTHIGIKGFPKFQVHVGYEYQEISRSFTPLRIFRCWWSPNVIHCMALLVNDYCMTNGVKSTLICLKVFWCTEKEELENILQNVFCSMQLANVKWRQLRIDKNLSKRYTYKLHVIIKTVLCSELIFLACQLMSVWYHSYQNAG